MTDEDFQKFIPRFGRGLDFPDFCQWGIHAYLLHQLPMSSLFIGLTGIDMPCCARTPEIRMILLPGGAFLEKQLAGPVEEPDMDSPMKQLIHMHLITRLGADDCIACVHDIKNFLGRIDFGMLPISAQQSEFCPIIHGQILRPCRKGMPLGSSPLLPSLFGKIKERSELLAAGMKPLPYQLTKAHRIAAWQASHGTLTHLDDDRLDGRSWPEHIRRHDTEFFHVPASS